MLLRTSRSSAQPAERPVLAPVWLIALLALLVGGALVLLYPRQDLERRLSDTTDTALSVSYLNNLLRSDPDNPRLRLLLAQRQIAQGDVLDARATLQPALESSNEELRRDALWALWELSYAEWVRTPETDPVRREAMRGQLRAQLQSLAAQTWSTDRQIQLARLAAQFNEPAVGIELNRRLAQAEPDPRKAAQLYERAAKEALAQSDYIGCAELYMLARNITPDAQQAKAYFQTGVRALQSGNQPLAALQLAQRELGSLADDRETLLMLTNLARAAGRPDVADRFVRKLLRLSLMPQWPEQAIAALAALDTPEAAPALLRTLNDKTAAALPSAGEGYDDGAYLLRPPSLNVAAPSAKTEWSFRAAAAKATPGSARNIVGPELPFDDKIYTLGYEVFLENRKQEDAWLVANAAVQQRPDDLAWRERLARVSDWTQRPAVALENWLYLARKTQREEAWQAVLRIAPGQFDDHALVLALRHQLQRKPDDDRLVRELVAAYERLGEPQPAIDYLQQHARTPRLQELLAQLADRAGRPEVALAAWRQLLSTPTEVTPARAMPAAILALTHGRGEEGLQWLEAAQRQPPRPEEATDYWRLTGQLAEMRQRQGLAIDAYRKLAAGEDADISDYDALIRLLQTEQPLEAAKVSEQAWLRFDDPRHFIGALNLYSNRSRWDGVESLLVQLDARPEARKRSLSRLSESPEFLRLVGLYHQNNGRPAEARRYFEAGLRVSPDSAAMRQALLWLFIDGNDATSLRTLLAERERHWAGDNELHDALAAAYQALSLPQVALDRYLTPRLKRNEKNFLWLMNYADALDQNQQTDRSWRLRRHLLAQEWQGTRQQDQPASPRLTNAQARSRWLTEEGLDQTRRIARTRLILTQRPGDASVDVLRELLRLDRDAAGSLSNAAAETAIGWLQDAGEYSAERGFLWQQYARTQGVRANRPLWAEITLALAENDKTAAGQLLQEFDERLPRYDRVNAARAVNDMRLAQTAAFETQNDQHDDQPLHLQLTESLLAFSDHAGTKLTYQDLAGMRETQAEAVLHLAFSPRLSLDVNLIQTRRWATSDTAVFQPPQERGIDAELHWRHRDGETIFRAGRRESDRAYTPLAIEHEQRIDNRLSWRFDVGSDLPSQDSLALRIAGMKDRVGLSLRYQATRQDEFVLSQWAERYQLQTGGNLGSGQHTSVNYTHTYRQEAPLLQFGAFWSNHDYKRRDLETLSPDDQGFRRYLPPSVTDIGPNYFLPDNFQFYGIQLSTNTRYEQEYTRAIRPFASVSRTWHSQQGPGYGLRAGLAGSLLGGDHIRLSWGLGKSGVQNQGLTRELQFSYRLHF
ncbi:MULTISPECIES: tetratricopeptide repeat protein [unclassified Acidovorax]|uniref:tetratricopeptide repeat protein n=1 Tax=unclassified Acidovorax TaxID=2684926 RepID=UPI00288356BD|nr:MULTISPECIES: tetratricopeptide repeat protein [unclassified Acidovorax]